MSSRWRERKAPGKISMAVGISLDFKYSQCHECPIIWKGEGWYVLVAREDCQPIFGLDKLVLRDRPNWGSSSVFPSIEVRTCTFIHWRKNNQRSGARVTYCRESDPGFADASPMVSRFNTSWVATQFQRILVYRSCPNLPKHICGCYWILGKDEVRCLGRQRIKS